MVGMDEIATAAAGINSAFAIGKTILKADGAIETAELKLQLADMMTNLADAKMALAEMGDAISEKDVEIERLKEAFAFKDEVIEAPNQFYYKKHETGVPVGRPFCPRCQEVDGRWVMLQKPKKGVRGDKFCPQCDRSYNASSYSEPKVE